MMMHVSFLIDVFISLFWFGSMIYCIRVMKMWGQIQKTRVILNDAYDQIKHESDSMHHRLHQLNQTKNNIDAHLQPLVQKSEQTLDDLKFFSSHAEKLLTQFEQHLHEAKACISHLSEAQKNNYIKTTHNAPSMMNARPSSASISQHSVSDDLTHSKKVR